MLDLDNVKSRYDEAFQLFLAGEVDEASDRVAVLGAEVRTKGGGLESLVEIHTSCFGHVAERTDPLSAGKVLVESSPLLVRGVMGYAMNYCMTDVVGSVTAELEALQTQLCEARRRLREDDEFQTLFATPISHELRNPLNSIIGFTNILLNEWAGPLNSEQKENLRLVLDAGQRLLQIVNDLVDICRIESGVTRSNVREVFLRDVIEETLEKLPAGAVHVDMANEQDSITTDDRRLVQALENVVGTMYPLSSDLHCAVEGNAGGAVITITFNAESLPADRVAQLFQPLFRLDGSRPVHGTGLSLYLSRIIIRDLLGGEIRTSAGADGEVILTVTLPASVPA